MCGCCANGPERTYCDRSHGHEGLCHDPTKKWQWAGSSQLRRVIEDQWPPEVVGKTCINCGQDFGDHSGYACHDMAGYFWAASMAAMPVSVIAGLIAELMPAPETMVAVHPVGFLLASGPAENKAKIMRFLEALYGQPAHRQ